jgi:hypothetical protein
MGEYSVGWPLAAPKWLKTVCNIVKTAFFSMSLRPATATTRLQLARAGKQPEAPCFQAVAGCLQPVGAENTHFVAVNTKLTPENTMQ